MDTNHRGTARHATHGPADNAGIKMNAGAQSSSTTQQAHSNPRSTPLTRPRPPQPHQPFATSVATSASRVVALSDVPIVQQSIARRAAPDTSACARTSSLCRGSDSTHINLSARPRLRAPTTAHATRTSTHAMVPYKPSCPCAPASTGCPTSTSSRASAHRMLAHTSST